MVGLNVPDVVAGLYVWWRRSSTCAMTMAALLLCACSLPQSQQQASQRKTVNEQTLRQLQIADDAYARGAWNQASAAYERLTERVPDSAYFYFRLGNSLAYAGDYARAIVALERSIELDSTQTKSLFNLSTTHLLAARQATRDALALLDSNDPVLPIAKARSRALHELID